MGILKRIFSKKKKEKQPEKECWYNNAHEESFARNGEPLENIGLCSPHQPCLTSSKQAQNAK